MGEDFRAQSAGEAVYYRDVDHIQNDENPDERLGNAKYLWFTGGLAFGSLILLAVLFAYT